MEIFVNAFALLQNWELHLFNVSSFLIDINRQKIFVEFME